MQDLLKTDHLNHKLLLHKTEEVHYYVPLKGKACQRLPGKANLRFAY